MSNPTIRPIEQRLSQLNARLAEAGALMEATLATLNQASAAVAALQAEVEDIYLCLDGADDAAEKRPGGLRILP